MIWFDFSKRKLETLSLSHARYYHWNFFASCRKKFLCPSIKPNLTCRWWVTHGSPQERLWQLWGLSQSRNFWKVLEETYSYLKSYNNSSVTEGWFSFSILVWPPAKNKFILGARRSGKSIDLILLIKPTEFGILEVYYNSSSTGYHEDEDRIVGALHFLLLLLDHRWVGLWGKKQATHDFVYWNLSRRAFLCMYNNSLVCWCVWRVA